MHLAVNEPDISPEVGGPKRAKRRVKIGLKFVRWTETQLRITTNVTSYLPDAQKRKLPYWFKAEPEKYEVSAFITSHCFNIQDWRRQATLCCEAVILKLWSSALHWLLFSTTHLLSQCLFFSMNLMCVGSQLESRGRKGKLSKWQRNRSVYRMQTVNGILLRNTAHSKQYKMGFDAIKLTMKW